MSVDEFCLERSQVIDMNVTEHTFGDVNTHGGDERPLCTGLTPDVLPEVQKPVLAKNSQTGVSTKNVLSGTTSGPLERKPKESPHWYALRVTYGRERKAYDYLVEKHVEAFYPTVKIVKKVGGKRKTVEESRLPNIFFARGTKEEIQTYVYDNVNLPYLRFYYRHFHEGVRIVREPLIVPDYQIESLKIICASEATDIVVVSPDVRKFETGQMVSIIDGGFKGVVGKVARYQGQQRVAVTIEGLFTIATAYIPSAFLQRID